MKTIPNHVQKRFVFDRGEVSKMIFEVKDYLENVGITAHDNVWITITVKEKDA
jgi:hypothetical protein